jgi:fibronectin type 3 domain-containing protein
MKSIQYIIIYLLFSTNIFAQVAQNSFRITNTPNGIFIEFGQKSLIGKNVELLRKASNETSFKSIAKINAPTSVEEVKRKIFQASEIFVEGSRPNDKDLDKFWANYQAQKPNILSLVSVVPQFEYIFGLAFLDKDVRPNVKYQYQLTDGRNILFTSVNAVVYLKQKYFPRLQELAQTTTDKAINFEFAYPKQLFLLTKFEVKRKLFTSKSNEYQTIKPAISLPSDRKKESIILSDTTLTTYAQFDYQVRLSDIFGNKDTTTYHFEGKNIPTQLVAEITNIKIEPAKDRRAFVLTWNLTQKDFVQNIALFRSRDFDKNFVSIARFNKTDEIFTDGIEVANELYFYYFEVTDIFGNKRKTIKYQKVYEGSYIPTPPNNLSSRLTQQGIELTWQATDPNSRGFYVFRKEGLKSDFVQISPIVLSQKGIGNYADTTKLDAESTYYYAIKAESDTYEKSGFSDTLSYRPKGNQVKSQLKAPVDLNLTFRDGKVMLTWENLNKENPQVLGYQVLRKSESEKDFKIITSKNLSFVHNYYIDSTFFSENKYQYAIVSFDDQNHSSNKSSILTLDLTGKFLMTPDEIGFERKEKSILLKWTEIDENRIKNIKIYRSEDDGVAKLISTLDRNQRKYTDNNVVKGKSYIYQITTIDLSGKEGNRSEPILINN